MHEREDQFLEGDEPAVLLVVLDQIRRTEPAQTERALHEIAALDDLPGGQARFDAAAASEADRRAYRIMLAAVGASDVHFWRRIW